MQLMNLAYPYMTTDLIVWSFIIFKNEIPPPPNQLVNMQKCMHAYLAYNGSKESFPL